MIRKSFESYVIISYDGIQTTVRFSIMQLNIDTNGHGWQIPAYIHRYLGRRGDSTPPRLPPTVCQVAAGRLLLRIDDVVGAVFGTRGLFALLSTSPLALYAGGTGDTFASPCVFSSSTIARLASPRQDPSLIDPSFVPVSIFASKAAIIVIGGLLSNVSKAAACNLTWEPGQYVVGRRPHVLACYSAGCSIMSRTATETDGRSEA